MTPPHCRRCYCWPRPTGYRAADLALDNYRNALAVGPANRQAVLKVAGFAGGQGRVRTGERLLQGYLAGSPTNTEARRLLAESYSRQQRLMSRWQWLPRWRRPTTPWAPT